jgi:UDP-N-acetylmuramoyl-L-alanyl-D-glutamate--2,6-diaminopimelate ligase
LHCDSRKVQAGDGFIAWPGAATDGRKFVPAALQQGARACLVEAAGSEAFGPSQRRGRAYEGLKAATGPIGALFYGEPTAQLDVLAVTGTNGKTSTAWWLAQALANLRPPVPCGLVGTLGIGRPPHVEHTGLTTPDPVLMQRHFRRFLAEGAKACAIEAPPSASRSGAWTARASAWPPSPTSRRTTWTTTAAWRAYWAAKAQLFHWPGLQAAVLNLDDEKAEVLERQLEGSLDVWTVSCERPARLQAQEIGYGDEGLRFAVVEGSERHLLQTKLIGQYNVSNLLGVLGMMRAIGVPLAAAVAACADLLPVPGRMERLNEPASRWWPSITRTPRMPWTRACRRCGRWPPSAAASCGACSAAAATATRPSAR